MKINVFFLVPFLTIFFGCDAMKKKFPQEKNESGIESPVKGKKRKLLESTESEEASASEITHVLSNLEVWQEAGSPSLPESMSCKEEQLNTKNEIQPTQEELAAFEKLPDEVKKIIVSYLVTATGHNNTERLYSATKNIRSLMMINKDMRAFLNDANMQSYLIKELANRYTNGNVVTAAKALGTKTASQILLSKAEKYQSDLKKSLKLALQENSYEDVNFLLTAAGNKFDKDYLGSILVKILSDWDKRDFAISSSIVKRLINAGANVNVIDKFGNNAIYYAADNFSWISPEDQSENLKKIIWLLFNAGTNIFHKNKEGISSFPYVPWTKDTELIKAALKKGGFTQNDLDEALIRATNSKEIVGLLLAAGANPNYYQIRLKNNYETALVKAIEDNNLEVVKLLLENGAHVNFYRKGEESPLHRAIIQPFSVAIPFMKILLAKGADVNEINPQGKSLVDSINANKRDGWTPAHKKEAIELLRKYGLKEGK